LKKNEGRLGKEVSDEISYLLSSWPLKSGKKKGVKGAV